MWKLMEFKVYTMNGPRTGEKMIPSGIELTALKVPLIIR
jgi:hypothetical protein